MSQLAEDADDSLDERLSRDMDGGDPVRPFREVIGENWTPGFCSDDIVGEWGLWTWEGLFQLVQLG